MLRLVIAFALLSFSLSTALAQSVSIVPTAGKVTAIVQTPAGSYIETERGTFSITEGVCEAGLCLKADVIRGLPKPAPEGALPDGFIATAKSGDIRKAWYGRPTDRYAHGVLGDAIEGGSLVVELADGTLKEFVLPESQVFEDITPRIHDLDFDGDNEVVTIRSSQTGGAAIVIYSIVDNALVEVGASPENGQRNRWLNIAGIVEYFERDIPERGGDSHFKIIVGVRTPHIGGRLFSLFPYDGIYGGQEDLATGISNHIIGSRELGLSAMFGSGNNARLYVPSLERSRLIAVTDNGQPIPLPGKIDKAIISLENILVTATETGQLLAIEPE